MKKLLVFIGMLFSFAASTQIRVEPRPSYQAEIVTTSWNRWEHITILANGDSLYVNDNVEVYNVGAVFERWRVDYGQAHKDFWGWRYYDTLDIWYDMTLSLPLRRRIEIQEGVRVYDMSPSHFVFASMDLRNEVSAFTSVDAFHTEYWRATERKVGIRMNGLPSLKYRVRVGLMSAEVVRDRSFGAEHVAGIPVTDWSVVEIGGKKCDSERGVYLDIPGGGIITDVTPRIYGEDYYRWGDFFVGQPVVIPAPRTRLRP